MHTKIHRNSAQFIWRFTAVAVVLLSFLGLGAGVASAHTELMSSTPANGAVLANPPASVSFVFGEPLLPTLDTVSINDAEGSNLAQQKVTPTGNQISIQWPNDLPAGEYEVAYRVVSEDGHPLSDAIRFSYGRPTPEATTAVTPDAPADEQSTQAIGPWAIGLGIVLLAGSIGVIYVLVKRRR
ncbi:MAG: copper resistance protein CopC [Actinomycetota bacterium]|nr:copper resistance protein CopC [Actinomycetota bacterium]